MSNADRDVLQAVSRAASAALSTQASHNDGFQRLADATARIERHWDELEQNLSSERATVARLGSELEASNDRIDGLQHEHATELAIERRNHSVQILALQEKARDDLEALRTRSDDEITSVRQVATRTLEESEAAHIAEVARLRAQIAELSTHNNALSGQLEIERFDNEQLGKGLNMLLTSAQNTSRAMVEEEAQINALADRLSNRLDSSLNFVSQALKSGEVVQLFETPQDAVRVA